MKKVEGVEINNFYTDPNKSESIYKGNLHPSQEEKVIKISVDKYGRYAIVKLESGFTVKYFNIKMCWY